MRMDVVLTLCALLLSCAPSAETAPPPVCSDAEIEALGSLYKAAALGVIEAGKCDTYQRVEECPAYRATELHFRVALEGMCRVR